MIITVINVSEPTKVKSYFTIEVNYKDEKGSVQGKKLTSFSYPTVFNTVKTLVAGDRVNVTIKKEGDYWNWVEVKKLEAAEEPTKAQTYAASSSDRYETKEERQQRQVMIVRQSSLSTAVQSLAVGAKSALDADAVIEVAKKFEKYVLQQDAMKAIVEMADDIPE